MVPSSSGPRPQATVGRCNRTAQGKSYFLSHKLDLVVLVESGKLPWKCWSCMWQADKFQVWSSELNMLQRNLFAYPSLVGANNCEPSSSLKKEKTCIIFKWLFSRFIHPLPTKLLSVLDVKLVCCRVHSFRLLFWFHMVHLFVLLAAFTQSDCCLLCSCLLRPYSSSIILAFLFYAFEFFFFFFYSKGLKVRYF